MSKRATSPARFTRLEALKRAMKWDEDTYGLEYDLDIFQIVAVSEFNMGAMENKGLNIFNAKFILADPETATDQDYAAIEAVIAHEYFHNWTGNRVTCRDWFQLSLKEGLDRLPRSAVLSGHALGRRRAHQRRAHAAQRAVRRGRGPARASRSALKSYLEINNFYTATVYEKGAEVIRMIETLIGVDAFRRGMTLYLTKNDGRAATVDDFVAAMEEASGRDLDQFRLWYCQAGTPQISVHAVRGRDGSVRLTLKQRTEPTPGQPEKLPLHIPLVLGLVGADGRNVPLRLAGEPASAASPSRVLDFRAAEEQTSTSSMPAPRAVPSLFRGFSAPCKIVQGLSDEDHAFLLGHDSDPFNRWDAGQQFATKLVLSLVARNDDTPRDRDSRPRPTRARSATIAWLPLSSRLPSPCPPSAIFPTPWPSSMSRASTRAGRADCKRSHAACASPCSMPMSGSRRTRLTRPPPSRRASARCATPPCATSPRPASPPCSRLRREAIRDARTI